MIIIASGWREYADPTLPEIGLNLLWMWAAAAGEGLEVIHGDGRGLDQLVKTWCIGMQADGERVRQTPYPADWARLGRRAGRLRNEQMWTENWPRVDLCLGFPGPAGISTGTPHCMELARQHNCPVWAQPWGATEITKPPKARCIPNSVAA